MALNLGSCIAGIPIRLHYTFFLLLAIELISSLRYGEPLFILLLFLLYGPILLITIIVHELGHALTTKKLGGEVGGIILWPLGGFALCGPTDRGASGDLKVAIAGPLTHIPQMLTWLGVYAAVANGDFSNFGMSISLRVLQDGGGGFMSVLSAQSFWLNLFLMIFNLFVPAYPLDGGRCLAATLILCGVSVRRTALATSVTGMLIAMGLAVWGLVSFFVLEHHSGMFTALIGLFIFHSSKELFDMTKTGRINEHPIFGRRCYSEQEPASNADENRTPAESGTIT